ncbi:uncharacterized protein J4E88_010736 [Alternaria novae-zelandiae]|uniref:uncharacterized protein n=1 Tax=Alternaria novae-zelandiae TaxID=430562 RepID=UPI0020C43FCE|nr:uncharacterized protein J4E88_010736 [Alternaria novae-zelandiae]KAI4614045.1 hypothetical protein J4E80_006735 [Alternaria sp. BMP 0032]KAI4664484.1 hypothetical protein J4E88_010736 [Alternaria novae-zelandiae]
MAEAARSGFQAAFKSLRSSGAFSDLTITCGNDSYQLHKAIVYTRAPKLALAKQNEDQPPHDKLTLSAKDSATFKLLLQYIYEGEYDPVLPDNKKTWHNGPTPVAARLVDDGEGNRFSYGFPHKCKAGFCTGCNSKFLCPHHVCGPKTCDQSTKCTTSGFTCLVCKPSLPKVTGGSKQLLHHIKLYTMAEKYDAIGLQDLIKEKFSRACRMFYDTPEFAQAARAAWSSPEADGMGLRTMISQMIACNMAMIEKPEIEDLLATFPRLSHDVLKQKREREKNGEGKECTVM